MSYTNKPSGFRARLESHNCAESGNPWWRLYDAQRIYLCRVCDDCEEVKRERYRPEILDGYTQDDVNEPIEGE